MGRPRVWPPRPGKFRGRERVWWNGKYHDLGLIGSQQAKAEYGRLLALWAADPTAAPRRADDYLVVELARDFLASDAAPTEARQRTQAVTALDLLAEHHLTTPAAEFGPLDLAAWQKWLGSIPHDRRGTRFNATSVRHFVGEVKRVWKWAVATNRLGAERWQALLAVPPPKPGDARPGRLVDPADPAAVRKTAPLLRAPVRAMALLQWMTGAQPDELCGLRAGDVRRAGKVHVPGAGQLDLDAEGVWVVPLGKHKTARKGKPRWLTLGPDAQAVLLPFLDRPPDAFCFSPREAVGALRAEQQAARLARGGGSGGSRKKPAATPRRVGDRYTPVTYRQAAVRAAERAGVAHWFPYQLRHLAAAEVKAAFGIDTVQALLGHHTRTMAEHYGGASFKRAAEASRRPGGATERQQEKRLE